MKASQEKAEWASGALEDCSKRSITGTERGH